MQAACSNQGSATVRTCVAWRKDFQTLAVLAPPHREPAAAAAGVQSGLFSLSRVSTPFGHFF